MIKSFEQKPPQNESVANRSSDMSAQILARSEAICQAQGVRLTPIRRRVLEILYTSSKPLGAYELAEVLSPGQRRIAPITVYRTLDFLIDQGLAHRLASRNAYIANHNGFADGAATFLICEDCGGVDEVTSPEFGHALTDLLNQSNFQARARVLEVTGRCSRCQGMH